MFHEIVHSPILKYTLPLLVLFACENYPETPEEVVRKYETYMSTGECERALELCTDAAKINVQGSIDAGCMKIDMTIDSVTCQTNGSEAECICYRTIHDPKAPISLYFSLPTRLKYEDDKWKIDAYLLPDL